MDKYNFVLDKDEQTSISQYFTKVFGLMSFGLVCTALIAYSFASSELTQKMFEFGGMVPFYVLMGFELLLVWYLSKNVLTLSKTISAALFVFYALLNGVTLSVIFYVYSMGSIASTFFITSATFGLMSLYGYITKTDLTKLGSFLMMGVMGIVVASVVNIFLGSDTLQWIISFIGVFIFIGLTAYDTQKIKNNYYAAQDDNELKDKLAITGALSLYLDFINLFLFLLRFIGGSRD